MLQILDLGRAQPADALIDLDEFGAELLEAAEGGHLAFGLAHLGRRGERERNGLAADLVGQSRHGAMAGMALLGAGAVGLAATAEEGLDGTAAEVTDLGQFEQESGAAVFQGSEGIGQGPPCHRNVAHPMHSGLSRRRDEQSAAYESSSGSSWSGFE